MTPKTARATLPNDPSRALRDVLFVLAAIAAGWIVSRYALYPTLGVPENAPMILRPVLGFFVAWWLLRRAGGRWADLGLRRPQRLLLALLATVLLYACIWAAVRYLVPIVARAVVAQSAPAFLAYIRASALAFAGWLLIAWVVGAFVEELLFRGFLLNRVADLFATPAWGLAAGVVFQAALFGALHLYQGTFGFVFTGIFALIYGVAYIAFGRNLWPLIIVHGTWNSASIVRIYGG